MHNNAQKSPKWLHTVQELKLKIIFKKIELNEIIHVQLKLKHPIDSYQCQQV